MDPLYCTGNIPSVHQTAKDKILNHTCIQTAHTVWNMTNNKWKTKPEDFHMTEGEEWQINSFCIYSMYNMNNNKKQKEMLHLHA